ncbi:MAG: hypothetical protein ABW221_03375 [Vicinamibacteria bacterium]
MSAQTIVWAALPGGFADAARSRPRLSVYVSPRLEPDGEGALSSFDFLDWPARLASSGARFEVHCGSGRPRATVVSRPRSDLWSALFDGSTLVRPSEPSPSPRVFGTFPMARLHDQIRAGYQSVCAGAPDARLARDVVARAFPDAAKVGASSGGARERAHFAGRLVDRAQDETSIRGTAGDPSSLVPIVPDDGSASSAFEQFMVFAAQPRGSRRGRSGRRRDARLDFHELVSSLGEYPLLMRLLGLVIDLELDPGDVPDAADAAPGRVRVVPRFERPFAMETTHLSPDTAYVFARSERFRAAAVPAGDAQHELVDGLLDLGQSAPDGSEEGRFRILQADVQAAALQLLGSLGTGGSDGTSAELPHGLPQLRDAGISIVRRGHAQSLLQAMGKGREKMDSLLAGRAVTFFAEDLMRGYRIDVREGASGQWRSLHQREGQYTFLRSGDTLALADEGCAQPSLVRPAPDSAGADEPHDATAHFTAESLFVWNGWSLSARRPGPVLEGAEPEPGRAGPSFLQVAFAPAPKSLPRLRFGEAYALRARAVDLAGNALTLEEATAATASLGTPAVLPRAGDPFSFRRLESVGAPVLVARAAAREGESLERVVIRSSREHEPEGWTALHPAFLHSGERHLAPPPTFQLMAEMHGRFDPALADEGALDEALLLLQKGSAGPAADVPQPDPVLRTEYLPDPLAAGVAFRDLPGVPGGTIGRVREGRLEFEALRLPSDAAGDSLLLVDFGPAAAWPNPRPFRLCLRSGREAPRWDDASRELSVFLEPGATRVVRASCFLRGEQDLALLGIAEWVEDDLREQAAKGAIDAAALSARLEEWRQRALFGQAWMLTPYRELTLVHAVERPVEAPLTERLETYKLVGQTWTYVHGRVRVHGPSTGRLELVAEWTEPHDVPGEDVPPIVQQFRAPVFASPFHLSQEGGPAPGDPGAGRGDAIPEASFDPGTGVVEYLAPALDRFDAELKALQAELQGAVGRVRRGVLGLPLDDRPPLNRALGAIGLGPLASLIAQSPLLARWPEVIPLAEQARARIHAIIEGAEPAVDAPPGTTPFHLTPAMVLDLGTAEATAQSIVDKVREALRGRYRGRHEFGDTRHRRVRYHAVATSRFGEAFPPPAPEVTVASEPVSVDILSSARPAPPKVRYLVPTFGWTRTKDGATRTSRRTGGGVRVYLERPWFSSGEGELLAVVLDPSSAPGGTPPLERFITRWGRDPVWNSPRTGRAPAVEDFGGAPLVVRDVPLAAAATRTNVTAVAYPVAFHEDGRCFCDIEIAPGEAYWPFVRLALARFQPSSVPTIEMSEVVVADFVQLAPDRAVTVVEEGPGRFEVAVAGPTHASPADPLVPTGPTGTTVRVRVQARVAGTTDDVGWIAAPEVATIAATPAADLLWKGRVTLPSGAATGTFRLVVEELERRIGFPSESAEMAAAERVVFAETVEL